MSHLRTLALHLLLLAAPAPAPVPALAAALVLLDAGHLPVHVRHEVLDVARGAHQLPLVCEHGAHLVAPDGVYCRRPRPALRRGPAHRAHAVILNVGEHTECALLSADNLVHLPVQVPHHFIHLRLSLEDGFQFPHGFILEDAAPVLLLLQPLGSLGVLLFPGLPLLPDER